MENPLFNPDNVERFVQITGDPNPVHYKDGGYKQIAAGLHQTAVAIGMMGWRPGYTLDMQFSGVIAVPSENGAEVGVDAITYFADGNPASTGTYSSASRTLDNLISPITQPYEIIPAHENKIVQWNQLSAIPRGNELPVEAYAVATGANAIARRLYADPSEIERLWFPGIRENGTDGILIESLRVGMFRPSEAEYLLISVGAPQGDLDAKRPKVSYNMRGYDSDADTPVFSLELNMAMMNRRILERMLSR